MKFLNKLTEIQSTSAAGHITIFPMCLDSFKDICKVITLSCSPHSKGASVCCLWVSWCSGTTTKNHSLPYMSPYCLHMTDQIRSDFIPLYEALITGYWLPDIPRDMNHMWTHSAPQCRGGMIKYGCNMDGFFILALR